MMRYNKAGKPTTVAVAEAIERMRDVLFREYGMDFAFSVVARGAVLAAADTQNRIIHAVTCSRSES
ncbi:MAG: hypothetical protein ACTHU0_10020 [Kofleriaceae bacterium]